MSDGISDMDRPIYSRATPDTLVRVAYTEDGVAAALTAAHSADIESVAFPPQAFKLCAREDSPSYAMKGWFWRTRLDAWVIGAREDEQGKGSMVIERAADVTWVKP
jgi:hypothetical protein